MLADFKKLPVKIIESFLETRDSKSLGIPEAMGHYILQLNFAANTFRKEPSIQSAAKIVQGEFKDLSISTCRQRVFDAIAYLNLECSVTASSWNMYYADKMEDLFMTNLAALDLKEARKCAELARKYRIEASSDIIDPERITFKPQIVSPDMEIARMGVKKSGLLDAYNRGLSIINKLSISDTEKIRLQKELEDELGIEEAEEIK